MSDDAPTKGPTAKTCTYSGLSVSDCQDTICDCFTDGQDDGTSGIRPDAFRVASMSVGDQLRAENLDAASFALLIVEEDEVAEMRMFSVLALTMAEKILIEALAAVRASIEQNEQAATEGPF